MMRLILLAAGSSRRFGENKLMWPVDGKPMMQHILEILLRLEAERGWEVTVVAQEGPAAELARGMGARVVINALSGRGISSSIHAALNSITGAPCPAAFFVADQPYIARSTIAEFLDAFAASRMGLGCVAHGSELGNPAVFSPEYFPELMAIQGDRGGKAVIKRHMDDCCIYQVADARELRDLDTKPD
jgi:molybdenum cofactor cytidylyltransferase